MLDWLAGPAELNLYGSVASVFGVVLTLAGFGATLWNVRRSRKAAVRAEEASKQVLETVKLYDLMTDISRALAIIEELKRMHRDGDLKVVIERYAELKKILLAVRDTRIELSTDQKSSLQNTITTVSGFERKIEKYLGKSGQAIDVPVMNNKMSQQIEDLQGLLNDIRQRNGG